MVSSTGSILSLRSSQDNSLLMGANAKSCTVPETTHCRGTWKPVWKHFIHSFQNLAAGIFQALDADGNPHPLAGQRVHPRGYRFFIWVIQGDHEFFSNTLGLPHWRNNKLCWDCDTDITNEGTTWINLSNPGWTLKTAQEHLDTPPSHEVFTAPGVSTMMVCHDALHVMFNHGILSHFLGSILHLWCFHGPGRQTVAPATRLGIVFEKIQQFYTMAETDCRTRLVNLKLSMFCQEKKPHVDFPALKCKGGETKHLLPAMVWCMSLMYDGSELHDKIMAGLIAINKFVHVMVNADWVPTPREADRLVKYAKRFLTAYDWLEDWAIANERMLFHAVPKFHMFDHLAYGARFLNPTASWCFKAEDYVGKMSKMGASSVFGTKATKLSIKMMEKNRFMMHFRWTRPLVEA